ncbi:unnamed protein product [Urochloa humidicola]
MSVAASASAAGGFPKWALLEPYLFRRDDKDSFPDESEAPIRASGTTTWGADFSIAFSVAEPPRISRLYAHMPGFPGPDVDVPLAIPATHRHLALLDIITETPSRALVQNLFIFRADEKKPSSSLLKLLPTCTEPEIDYSSGDERLRPRRQPSNATPEPRVLDSLGLWCGGDKEEELVVAELNVCTLALGRCCTKVFADICLLRASSDGDQLGGAWSSMRVLILSADDNPGDADLVHDLWKLSRWQTDTIIPFQQWLCWIDYQKGILFCDVSNKLLPAPTISFLWFPLDKSSPLTSTRKTTCCNIFYGGVSVVDHGRLLKFVNVARHDGLVDYEALEPDTGFTITCHSLVLGSNNMAWKEDYTVTSDDLPDHLPRGIPMFPRVDLDRPHVVHFVYIEFGCAYEKMWVLSIDMSTKTVESFYLYMDVNVFLKMDENARLQIDDVDFIKSIAMSPTPSPFLPCEFPRFCCILN